MKKTLGLMMLLASSAAVLVSPAMARDRNDYSGGDRADANYQTNRYRDDGDRDDRGSWNQSRWEWNRFQDQHRSFNRYDDFRR